MTKMTFEQNEIAIIDSCVYPTKERTNNSLYSIIYG